MPRGENASAPQLSGAAHTTHARTRRAARARSGSSCPLGFACTQHPAFLQPGPVAGGTREQRAGPPCDDQRASGRGVAGRRRCTHARAQDRPTSGKRRTLRAGCCCCCCAGAGAARLRARARSPGRQEHAPRISSQCAGSGAKFAGAFVVVWAMHESKAKSPSVPARSRHVQARPGRPAGRAQHTEQNQPRCVPQRCTSRSTEPPKPDQGAPPRRGPADRGTARRTRDARQADGPGRQAAARGPGGNGDAAQLRGAGLCFTTTTRSCTPRRRRRTSPRPSCSCRCAWRQ